MKNTISVSLLLMALAGSPAYAADDGSWHDWRTTERWFIGWNEQLGGCAFYATYNDIVLRVDVHSDDSGEIALVRPNWNIKEGQTYKIAVVFDGNEVWNAAMRAQTFVIQNTRVGMLSATASLILQSISRYHNLQFYLGNGRRARLLASLNLAGTEEAFGEALKCKESRLAVANNNQPPEEKKPPESGNSPPAQGVASGTGIIVSASGNVLTANHVVSDCTSHVNIVQSSGDVAEQAHVLRSNTTNDLAIIKIGDLKVDKVASFRLTPSVKDRSDKH